MTLSSRPIATSRSAPCPVCEATSGGCRTLADDTVFCHTMADFRQGQTVRGYVCVKEAVGHTATFKPDSSAEWTEERRQEWKARKLARQQESKQQEQLSRERALSADERHSLYSQILNELTLDDNTLNDLRRRGFTQSEINSCGFGSVSKWQKLTSPVTPQLPGVTRDGRGLIVSGDGYLCPLYDVDGRIVAVQLRLHNPTDDNRYRWLSSKNQTLALYPESENPLSVLRPTGKPEGIILTEGVGCKPFLAARRLNSVALGAAGGQWASSPKLLKSWLEQLHGEVGGEKTVTLYPDAGDICNKDVVRRWRKIASLLTDWGWQVRFGWWAQVSKEDFGDIDELSTEQLTWIRKIELSEFESLAVKWGGLPIPSGTGFATPINYEERLFLAQKRLHGLSYPADVICDADEKYLPDLLPRIPSKGLVVICSPKGSGKSFQIKKLKDHHCGYETEEAVQPAELPPEQMSLFPQKKKIEPEPEKIRVWHKGLGKNFVTPNPRIALGREQSERWGHVWIEDIDTAEGRAEFGGEKIASEAALENIPGVGLCWDSFGKLANRDFSNTLLAIDEVELAFSHITTSSTCKDRRPLILRSFETKLRETLDNDGLVIISDADVSDSTLDYLRKLAPNHPPFIVKHDYKGDKWQVDFRTGRRDSTLDEIEEHLTDPDCQPIVVCLDNQGEAQALSEHLIKKLPHLRKQIGGLIRIDSKVTQLDFGREFVRRPNESILKYLPKVLIHTPSLGVGCSIDVKYFTHVYGLFYGNLEPSQCRQMLARVRDNARRTIWCKERANNQENHVTSYLPEEIKSRLFTHHDGIMAVVLTALETAKAQSNAEGIQDPQDKDLLPKLIETLQQMQGQDGSWNNAHVDLYCDQVAKRNYSLNQLALQLREELIAEGHSIADDVTPNKSTTGDAITHQKDENKRQQATMTAQVRDISIEEAQELSRKPTKTEEEICASTKAILKKELPEVELTGDFLYKAVYADDRRWLNKVKLFWMCQNPEAVEMQDEKEWRYRLKLFSKGTPFLPDVKVHGTKVQAINKSGIFELISLSNLKQEYSENDLKCKEFLSTALRHRKLLKVGLGITVTSESSIIQLAGKILNLIGLKLTRTRTENKVRYYRLDENTLNDPDRLTVLESLKRRFESEKMDKNLRTSREAEMHTGNESQRRITSNNLLYKKQSDAPKKQPDEIPLANVLQKVTNSQEEPVNDKCKNEEEPAEEAAQEQEELLLGVREMLDCCDNPQMLNEVRAIYPAGLLRLAARELSLQQKDRIRAWLAAS